MVSSSVKDKTLMISSRNALLMASETLESSNAWGILISILGQLLQFSPNNWVGSKVSLLSVWQPIKKIKNKMGPRYFFIDRGFGSSKIILRKDNDTFV